MAPDSAQAVVSPGTSSEKKSRDEPGSFGVDYVLEFSIKLDDAKSKKGRGQGREVQERERGAEFEKLVSRLQLVGLKVTVRQGSEGSNRLLVFVSCPDDRLNDVMNHERLSDWLHGVKTSFVPGPAVDRRSSSRNPETLSSAERLRHVHHLLVSPPRDEVISTKASTDADQPTATVSAVSQNLPGAGVRPGSEEFPHLLSLTPLHDATFNREWLQRWSSGKGLSLRGITLAELDSVRNHFGEAVALYFAFLNYYFLSLLPIAVLGLSVWSLGVSFSALYSLLAVGWSTVFVESWRMRERKLSVRWGTRGVRKVESKRHGFKPERREMDEATGEIVEVFPWWKRDMRTWASLPVLLLFAALLGAVMTVIFVLEEFVSQLYDGPGHQYVPYIPTVIFATVIPSILALWQETATGLTNWENHHHESSHDYSLTIKMFALNAFVAYGALMLSAYVYIPFGSAIVDRFGHTLGLRFDGFGSSSDQSHVDSMINGGKDVRPHFEVSTDRLEKQLFAYTVTGQVTNLATELIVPWLKRLVMHKVHEHTVKKSANDQGGATSKNGEGKGEKTLPDGDQEKTKEEEEDKVFVERVEAELELPEYSLFVDYAEMATQFGYVTLWSVAWPLAGLMAYINNFVEIRSDALKICVHARRPVPYRTETIGPWLETMGFISWLSALTNASLVYLFGTSGSSFLSPLRSANSAVFSSICPGAVGAVLSAALVALGSEQAYGFLRSLVRHVLERALWLHSEEEMQLRRMDWDLKRDFVARSGAANAMQGVAGGGAGGTEALAAPSAAQEDSRSFWGRGVDGVAEIRRAGKTE